MGREESKAQAKEAQKAQSDANAAKKTVSKDKVWDKLEAQNQGGSAKKDPEAEAAAAAKKAETKALAAAEEAKIGDTAPKPYAPAPTMSKKEKKLADEKAAKLKAMAAAVAASQKKK